MSEALSLPPGHGLAAGRYTVPPGASAEHGNVVVSCPTGDSVCVVNVAADGAATYDKTGGIPAVMAVYEPWVLPSSHGLVAGRYTVQPGASEVHGNGNVVVLCPAGGNPCIVAVAADGTAAYDKTGGVPAALAKPEELPELPLQRSLHAAQAPLVDLDDTLHVGADVAPSADQLAAAGRHNGVAVSYDRLRDGAGADEIIAYLNQQLDLQGAAPGFTPFSVQPTVRLAEGTSDALADYTLRAIQLINAALPPEKRILFSSDPAPPLAALEEVPEEEIFIDFAPWKDWNVPDKPPFGEAAGIANIQREDLENVKSHIWIEPAETVERIEQSEGQVREAYDNFTLSVVVHELIHAIGMNGHVDRAFCKTVEVVY